MMLGDAALNPDSAIPRLKALAFGVGRLALGTNKRYFFTFSLRLTPDGSFARIAASPAGVMR
jgi:hypothetical protein